MFYDKSCKKHFHGRGVFRGVCHIATPWPKNLKITISKAKIKIKKLKTAIGPTQRKKCSIHSCKQQGSKIKILILVITRLTSEPMTNIHIEVLIETCPSNHREIIRRHRHYSTPNTNLPSINRCLFRYEKLI